jgi:hypothetical protein
VSDDKRISIIHRLILTRLLIHRQKDGRCDPGYDLVAKELGVDRKTVMRAVDVGVRFGWLAPPIRGRRANAKFIFLFANQEVRPERDFLDNQEVPFSELRSPSKRVKKSLGKVPSEAKSKASTRQGHLTGKENGQKSQTQPPADTSLRKKESTEEEFEEFWRAYPKRVGEDAARIAFNKAIERGADPAAIIQAAKIYAITERARIERGEDPKYTAHPKNWLNAGRWKDPPPDGIVIDEDGNVVAIEQEDEDDDASIYSSLEAWERARGLAR